MNGAIERRRRALTGQRKYLRGNKMNDDELSIDVEAAAEPEREIDWEVTAEGETSLERLLYVLDID
jgi:hypothetical protein